jgi:hypothetical protein
MKYMFVTIACLAALLVSGCAMETEPEPANNDESSEEGHVGSTQEGLICNGIVVCVNHQLLCEPRFPGGKVTVVGGC